MRTNAVAAAAIAIVAVALVLVAVGLARTGSGLAPAGSTATTSASSPSGAGSPSAVGPASAGPASAGPAPASQADVTLVGAGDIGVCGTSDDEGTAELVQGLPGTVFTLGDDAYDQGSEQQFRDCFGPSWGRFKDRIAFPVPGNHEYETEGAAGYRAYFGTAATPEGETWYSRDVGAWHVVVLDATCDKVPGGCGLDSPQGRWLQSDLAANTAPCTLALWHQPRFSSGTHGNDDAVAPFWSALAAAGAELVLNGHDHDYERFAPQAPDGTPDDARGITEIVVGTGGAGLRSFASTRPNSVARSDTSWGVLELTLGTGSWSSRFQPTAGSFADDAGGACH